jgi:hypothetical protein
MAVLVAAALASAQTDETLRLGDTRSFRLEQNARVSYSASLPAGPLLLTLDARRADAREGSLRSELAILSGDGTLIQNAVLEDDAEIQHRGICRFNLSRAGTFSIEIRNAAEQTNYWLTITPDHAPPPGAPVRLAVPLFGDGQPIGMDPRSRQTGRLDKGEHAYFIAELPAGVYDVVLEFVNPNSYVTSLEGALTLLDGDGDTLQTVVRLDTNDSSAFESGTLSLSQGGVFLFKVYNQGGPSDEYYRRDFAFTLSSR